MTRYELESAYKVEGNRIVSPGKFESENIWCPYFWEAALDGGASEEWHGDGLKLTVEIEPEDVKQFPELEGFRSVEMYEDGLGFVYCEVRP